MTIIVVVTVVGVVVIVVVAVEVGTEAWFVGLLGSVTGMFLSFTFRHFLDLIDDDVWGWGYFL